MRRFYKALQMMRIAEAANLPVRIDWTQGSALLDTGHRAFARGGAARRLRSVGWTINCASKIAR
jgi:hypothetical protein